MNLNQKKSEPLAVLAKRSTDIPVIANGKLEDPEKALTFLEKDNADLISLGKGALANPNWPQRIRQGEPLKEFIAEENIKDSELC